MSIVTNNDLPLLIVGVECLLNPSFEDWVSGTPTGWTKGGSVSEEAAFTFPTGARSANMGNGATLSQAMSLSLMGLTTFPAWADAFVCVACTRGGNGSIQISGGSSAGMNNVSGKWALCYAQHSATGTVTITGGPGGTYVDSVMVGFAIDLSVPATKWNPVPKLKGEKRESPYMVVTQMVCDAWDLKATLAPFDATLKAKILGAITYMQRGHYFGMILDRLNSGPYMDEVLPYLYWDSQDSPTFTSGAPDVFGMNFNGRGCLP